MNTRKTVISFIMIFSFLGLTCLSAEETYQHSVTVDTQKEKDITITIPERGWYSLQADSKTGTAIAIVDRMSGVLAESGIPGHRDGNVDLLLEEGAYKIIFSPDQSTDPTHDQTPDIDTTLRIKQFKEQNGQNVLNFPFISGTEVIETTLEDGEIRSYWIHIDKNKSPFLLEVMGRNLKSCTLWEAGEWLVESRPFQSTYEPKQGKPMNYFEFSESLSAGTYLLQCTGGAELPWSDEIEKKSLNIKPLYLRRGAEYLGTNNVISRRISPFGRDSYLVSGDTNFFQTIRREKKQTRIEVTPYRPGESRNRSGGRSSYIDSKSPDPWCSVSYTAGTDKVWLTVEATPGETLELRLFNRKDYTVLDTDKKDRQYWISSILSAEAEQMIDLTAVLYRQSYQDPIGKILRETILPISSKKPLVRTINLFSQTIAIIYIEEGGRYRLVTAPESLAECTYRFLYFFDPEAYTSVEYQETGTAFELGVGYYFLELTPKNEGILSFAVIKDGSIELSGENVRETISAKTSPQIHSFIWSDIDVPRLDDGETGIIDNLSYMVPVGFTTRELPLNLNEPLALKLSPGNNAIIPVTNKKTSTLYFARQSGNLSVNNQEVQSGVTLLPGNHTIKVDNSSAESSYYSLWTIPLSESTPDLQQITGAPQEHFPSLTPGDPVFADFQHNTPKSFLLKVSEPSFYRIETSGRLSMELTIRTSTVPQLFSSRENGAGRNALIQTYLKPGYYLIQAGPTGNSKGRAGLICTPTPVSEGGRLSEEIIYRKTVPKDTALHFTLNIDEERNYTIDHRGMNKSFFYRLETEDGWPVIVQKKGNYSGKLAPATYSFYSLPEDFETKRLTRFSSTKETEQSPNDKNYSIGLNERHSRIWKETKPRMPDRFSLTIPATLNITYSLSEEMVASLVRPPLEDEIATIVGGEETSLELTRGKYAILVKSKEIDNNVSYFLAVNTKELAVGLSQTIASYPATLTTRVDEEGIYELWSYGSVDVKASLFEKNSATPIAENDDRKNDWNFRLSRQLKPGAYKLQIDSLLSSSSEKVEIHMIKRREMGTEERTIPFTIEKSVGNEVYMIPFTIPGTENDSLSETEQKEHHINREQNTDYIGAKPICISNNSAAPVNFALYRDNELIVSGPDTLYVTLFESVTYNLRLWHAQNTNIPLSVSVDSIPIQTTVIEQENVAFSVPGYGAEGENTNRISAVCLHNKGDLSFFLTSSSPAHTYYSPGPELSFSPLPYSPVNTIDEYSWIITTDTEPVSVTASPLFLSPGESITSTLAYGFPSFHLSNYENQMLLLKAESPGTEVSAMITTEDRYTKKLFFWEGCTPPGSLTLFGIPGYGEFQGKIWQTSPITNSTDTKISVAVEAYPFENSIFLSSGQRKTVSVSPGSAWKIETEPGMREIELLLSPGMVASIWDKDGAEATIYTTESNILENIAMQDGIISIANTNATGERLVRIQVAAEHLPQHLPPSLSLGLGESFETITTGNKQLNFEISELDDSKGNSAELPLLAVIGDNIINTQLKGADGKIYSSRVVPIDQFEKEKEHTFNQEKAYPNNSAPAKTPLSVHLFPGISGLLEVEGDGFIRVVCSTDEQNLSLSLPGRPIELKTVPFTGTTFLSEVPTLWEFTREEQGFIEIQRTGDGLACLYRGEQLLATVLSYKNKAGRKLYYAKPGIYTVFTRGFKPDSVQIPAIKSGDSEGRNRNGDGGKNKGQTEPGATLNISEKSVIRYESLPAITTSTPSTDGTAPRSARTADRTGTEVSREVSNAEFFIGPGETQIFSFMVHTKSVVGAGIKADIEAATAILYDTNFNELKSGNLIFEMLDPGKYFLLLKAHNKPVRYRPIILGTGGTRKDVPQDVINNYREGVQR